MPSSNFSLNGLSRNGNNLSSEYDSYSTPGITDDLDKVAFYMGLGADFPDASGPDGGNNIQLGNNFVGWAIYDSRWGGARFTKNIGGSGDEPDLLCNNFVSVHSHDLETYAFQDDTKIYKNGTLYTTLSASQHDGIPLNIGDRMYVSRPVSVGSGQYRDAGVVYMGWTGFAFALSRYRSAANGSTLYIVAPYAGTEYEVMYTTSTGNVTSLTRQANGNLDPDYDYAAITLSNTRYYYIYANKPVACYVKKAQGTETDDTFPLYPMDQDPKFGAFSNGGHIFLTNNNVQNRAGTNVTQQIFVRSSDGTSSTDLNSSNASPSVTTDNSPGKVSSAAFAGPVQKVQAGNNCLIAAEQNADGNGTESTPFVSKKSFGVAGIVANQSADWCCCIGESAMTIYHRDYLGRIKTEQTMAGSATYNLYFTRFTADIEEGDIFESNGTNRFIMYYDADPTNDDERVQFMSDTLLDKSGNYVAQNISGPFGDPGEACAVGPGAPTFTGYSVASFSLNEAMYLDSTLDTEVSDTYSDGSIFYNHATNQSFGYYRWTGAGTGNDGITDIQNC